MCTSPFQQSIQCWMGFSFGDSLAPHVKLWMNNYYYFRPSHAWPWNEYAWRFVCGFVYETFGKWLKILCDECFVRLLWLSSAIVCNCLQFSNTHTRARARLQTVAYISLFCAYWSENYLYLSREQKANGNQSTDGWRRAILLFLSEYAMLRNFFFIFPSWRRFIQLQKALRCLPELIR